MKDKFPKLIEKAKEEYDNPDVCKLSVVVNEIIRYTGIDKYTCVDYTNIKYAVCEILKNHGNSYAKDWHRPEWYEYETM